MVFRGKENGHIDKFGSGSAQPTSGEWRLVKGISPFYGLASAFISAHAVFVEAAVSV